MYKRLTERKHQDICVENIVGTFVIPNCNKTCQKAIERLAELEDKIENGTLIDTKVKVGQRVYMRGFFKCDFDEYIVSDITLDNGELTIYLKHDFDEFKTCYSVTVIDIAEIGKTVFLTKAEAEQR